MIFPSADLVLHRDMGAETKINKLPVIFLKKPLGKSEKHL